MIQLSLKHGVDSLLCLFATCFTLDWYTRRAVLDADNTGYKSSVDGLSIGSTFGILVVVLIT